MTDLSTDEWQLLRSGKVRCCGVTYRKTPSEESVPRCVSLLGCHATLKRAGPASPPGKMAPAIEVKLHHNLGRT